MNAIIGKICRGGGKTLNYLVVAIAFAAAQNVQAASLWRGTAANASPAANWKGAAGTTTTNGKGLGTASDNFYIRGSEMTSGGAYTNSMTLDKNVAAGTLKHSIFFQAGTENDPFVVYGTGRTVSYTKHSLNVGLYIGGELNNDNKESANVVFNGGTWNPYGVIIGGTTDSTLTGSLKLQGATLNCNKWDDTYGITIGNGKLVTDAASTVKSGNSYFNIATLPGGSAMVEKNGTWNIGSTVKDTAARLIVGYPKSGTQAGSTARFYHNGGKTTAAS